MADAVYWTSWWFFTVIGVGTFLAIVGTGDQVKALSDKLENSEMEVEKYKGLYEHNLNAARKLDHENHSLRLKISNLESGRNYSTSNRDLSAEDLKRLTMLCHPDKHGGKRVAVEMTQKLLSMRAH